MVGIELSRVIFLNVSTWHFATEAVHRQISRGSTNRRFLGFIVLFRITGFLSTDRYAIGIGGVVRQAFNCLGDGFIHRPHGKISENLIDLARQDVVGTNEPRLASKRRQRQVSVNAIAVSPGYAAESAWAVPGILPGPAVLVLPETAGSAVEWGIVCKSRETTMKNLIALPFFALLFAPGSLFAQESTNAEPERPGHDVGVQSLLDEAGLNYEIDGDGDFKLTFEYDDGRSHVVFVNSRVETWQKNRLREVWAVGWAPAEDVTKLPADVAANLIRANAKMKLGAWQVTKIGGREVAVFRVVIPADASGQMVKDSLRLVGSVADEMEAELLKSDDL